MAYVWEAFQELNNTRSFNGFGGNPITYTEILAWCKLTNSILTSQEIKVLKLLDNLFLVHLSKKNKEK